MEGKSMWRAVSILFFSFLLASAASQAAGLSGVWGDSGYGASGSSRVQHVAVGADGSIVAAGAWGAGPATLFGEPYDHGDGVSYLFLSKHDANGVLQWIQSVSAYEFTGLALGPGGDIAVSGRNNDFKGFVRKYGPDGTPLWESILDGCCDKIGVDVAVTSDGGVAAVGFWDYGLIYIDTLEVSVGEPVVAATLRYASDGTLSWYDTQGTVPQGVLVGPADEITEHAPLTDFRHFDASGNIGWSKSFWSPTGVARFFSSASGPGGDIFAAGDLLDSLEVDGITLGAPVGRPAIFVRIGPGGVLQWADVASGEGDIKDVAVDAQGNSFALGFSNDPLNFGGTVIPSQTDFLVIHDPAGNPVFACELDKGTGISAFNAMALSPFDGAIVIGGNADGPQTTAGILIDPGAGAIHGFLVDIASPVPTGVRSSRAPAVLLQAFPNPFNPRVTIRYTLPRAADVQLDIHAVNGALVRSLVQGYRAEGAGKAVWDGRDERGRTVGSGVYFAVLHAGNTHLVQKVTLLK
jgi:hypothetical protein